MLSLICAALGLVGGYFLPRPSKHAVNVAALDDGQRNVEPLTQADEKAADAAYGARRAIKLGEAEQLFTGLRLKYPASAPLEVEVGRTLLYEGKFLEATIVLKSAIAKGAPSAEAYFLLGSLFNAQKSYAEAELNFAKAAALDQTQANYYYLWGECLREQGKLSASIDKYRSALLRNEYETATGLYRAKLWLSEIEAGQEISDGANSQIDAALAQPRPPMEACFAAAARDIKAGDLRAAAGQLHRARRRSEPVVFLFIMNDPFFALVRSRPEFADLLATTLPDSSSPTTGGTVSPTASGTNRDSGPVAPPHGVITPEKRE